MKKTIRQVAKELKISPSYLSDILNSKKGCSEELMNKIKEYYPKLEFYNFIKPRYKVKIKENKYE